MQAGDKGEFGDSVATVMEGDGRRVFFSLWIESRTHTRNTGNGIGKDLPTPRTTTTVLDPSFVGGQKKHNKTKTQASFLICYAMRVYVRTYVRIYLESRQDITMHFHSDPFPSTLRSPHTPSHTPTPTAQHSTAQHSTASPSATDSQPTEPARHGHQCQIFPSPSLPFTRKRTNQAGKMPLNHTYT